MDQHVGVRRTKMGPGSSCGTLFENARFTDRIGRKAVEKRKLKVRRAEKVCLEMGRFEPTDRDSSDQTNTSVETIQQSLGR